MDFHFGCTQCGKCCRDLKLPLSVDEAIAWAERGHRVDLLVEGLPWSGEPHPDDLRAIHDRDRTFPASSGEMPIRIGIIPVAWHEGACPFLQADLRCGDYAQRPRICRIYPLMGRPFEALEIGKRLCPPEAWSEDLPVLMVDEAIADPEMVQVVAEHRRCVIDDIPTLIVACAMLGWSRAGFANEGFAVLSADPALLAGALKRARLAENHPAVVAPWTYVTNRRTTLATMQAAGCIAELAASGAGYLGSFSDEA